MWLVIMKLEASLTSRGSSLPLGSGTTALRRCSGRRHPGSDFPMKTAAYKDVTASLLDPTTDQACGGQTSLEQTNGHAFQLEAECRTLRRPTPASFREPLSHPIRNVISDKFFVLCSGGSCQRLTRALQSSITKHVAAVADRIEGCSNDSVGNVDGTSLIL